MADFLRLDADLLTVAAQASPPLAKARDDPGELARWIKELPSGDKETLLLRVAQGHGSRVQMELLRRFRGEPDIDGDDRPRRTVAELLDTAAGIRQERRRQAEAAHAAQEARRARERALARKKQLDALARDQETAWAHVDALIDTRRQNDYDAAVEILKDLQAVAARAGHAEEFARRFTLLRRRHLRKSSLIARFDRACLSTTSTGR